MFKGKGNSLAFQFQDDCHLNLFGWAKDKFLE